jgi:hypothetical protein
MFRICNKEINGEDFQKRMLYNYIKSEIKYSGIKVSEFP